jgi:hypothetical protein
MWHERTLDAAVHGLPQSQLQPKRRRPLAHLHPLQRAARVELEPRLDRPPHALACAQLGAKPA